MTLVPDRSKLQMKQEATLAMTVEQTILAELRELRESTDELKGQVRDLRTVMLGSQDGDTAFGRLPMVEDRLSKLYEEVQELKLAHVREGVYGSVLSKTGGFIAGVLGALITAVANIVFHFVWHR